MDAGRAKKLQKKCNKGEIFALDNYFECREYGIKVGKLLSAMPDMIGCVGISKRRICR